MALIGKRKTFLMHPQSSFLISWVFQQNVNKTLPKHTVSPLIVAYECLKVIKGSIHYDAKPIFGVCHFFSLCVFFTLGTTSFYAISRQSQLWAQFSVTHISGLPFYHIKSSTFICNSLFRQVFKAPETGKQHLS